MNRWLWQGSVWHRRSRPVAHAFRYPLYALCFPLSRQTQLAGPLLSLNRFNLLSFHERDHGPRDGSPLLPWIQAQLRQQGLGEVDGEVWLHTLPRVLGFVFNPVSFWYCHDRAGRLRAVLCEVNNTFGAHHSYLVAHADGRPIGHGDRLRAAKVLHVSPFCQPRGHYRFRFHRDDDASQVSIDYDDGGGIVLQTAIRGHLQPLTSGRLLAACLRYPWHTLGVWLRIHLQAWRLWRKGVPFFGKAPARHDARKTQ